MSNPSVPTRTSSSDDLKLFDLGGGKRAGYGTLRSLLPDVETALFFAKVYSLDYTKTALLLDLLFDLPVLEALLSGEHSTELQDYLVEMLPEDIWNEFTMQAPAGLVDQPPHGEILPELWAAFEIQVADSIKEVASKLGDVLALLPGKEGTMVFQHMAQLNRQRQAIGDYAAVIRHAPQQRNLVVLDVSGSMTEETIRAIVDDVVALSWNANAWLAVVSETATMWEPGTYTSDAVLEAAQFWGTHYEKLQPLFEGQDWGTVVTVADYDSSMSAKQFLAQNCSGRIGQVLDLSLVNRPTFLAECLGQFADSVKPLLVAVGNKPTDLR